MSVITQLHALGITILCGFGKQRPLFPVVCAPLVQKKCCLILRVLCALSTRSSGKCEVSALLIQLLKPCYQPPFFFSFLRSHIAIYNILWLERHQQDITRILSIFTCIRVHLLCSAQVQIIMSYDYLAFMAASAFFSFVFLRHVSPQFLSTPVQRLHRCYYHR